MYLNRVGGAGMALRQDNPTESSFRDAYPRHIVDSINMSTDLQKQKREVGLEYLEMPRYDLKSTASIDYRKNS